MLEKGPRRSVTGNLGRLICNALLLLGMARKEEESDPRHGAVEAEQQG